MIDKNGSWLGFSLEQWSTLGVVVSIVLAVCGVFAWGTERIKAERRAIAKQKAQALAAQVRASVERELAESQARLRGDRGFRAMMIERERIDPDWGWTDVTDQFFPRL